MIKISLRIFLLCISGFILNAQTSGKISGKIIEESSGLPLVGANVIITQTQSGTSADEEGFFNLINVSPGKYSCLLYTSDAADE